MSNKNFIVLVVVLLLGALVIYSIRAESDIYVKKEDVKVKSDPKADQNRHFRPISVRAR